MRTNKDYIYHKMELSDNGLFGGIRWFAMD
jgi:hypothetical protein